MKFLFSTVIWGKDYVDQFLKWSLPTQLAWGNLADFPWADTSAYMIMTTEEDQKRLQAAPLMRRLSRIMKVIYCNIDNIPRHNKYIGVSMAQLEALKRSSEYDAIFFIYPDFVCAAGSIQNAAHAIVAGWKAVAFPIPAILETIFEDPAIVGSDVVTSTIDGDVISIPPRLLVDASMRNCHPMISSYFVGGDKSSIGPAYMMWDVPEEEGWLLRCFHLHPFVIRVNPEDPFFLVDFNVSVDEEFVPRYFKSTDGIHFPSESDEFAMCSIRQPDSPPQPIEGPVRLENIVRWAEESASLVHRDFVLQPYRWAPKSTLPAEAVLNWCKAEERSKAYVEIVRKRLNVPDSVLEYEDPIGYAARMKRQKRFQHWRSPDFHQFVLPLPSNEIEEIHFPKFSLFAALIVFKNATGLYRLRKYSILRRLWARLQMMLES